MGPGGRDRPGDRAPSAREWGLQLVRFVPRTRVASVVIVLAASGVMGGCQVGLIGLIGAGSRAQGPYLSETIATEIGPASVRTIGCLDVGLVPFQRNGSALLDLHVGNRCGHPEAIDMRRLVIRGYDERGADHDVVLIDPRAEIALVHVGGSDRGHERIRLEGALGAQRLCFDLERINPDAPAARPTPLCFERTTNEWRPA